MENNATWNPQSKAELQRKQDVDMVAEYYRASATTVWNQHLNVSKNEQDGELPQVDYPSSDEARSPPDNERASAPTNPASNSDTTMDTTTPNHQNQAHSANGQSGC